MRLLAINLSANYVARILKVKVVKEKGNTEKKKRTDGLDGIWWRSKKINSDNLLAKINTKSKGRNFFSCRMTALLLLLQLYTIDDLSAFYFGFLAHLAARLRRRINNE